MHERTQRFFGFGNDSVLVQVRQLQHYWARRRGDFVSGRRSSSSDLPRPALSFDKLDVSMIIRDSGSDREWSASPDTSVDAEEHTPACPAREASIHGSSYTASLRPRALYYEITASAP